MKTFTLHIPKDVAIQLRRCRASIRESIRKRMQEIAESLATRPAQASSSAPQEPIPRFYVYEGYRVSYRVNPTTRKVVLIALESVSG